MANYLRRWDNPFNRRTLRALLECLSAAAGLRSRVLRVENAGGVYPTASIARNRNREMPIWPAYLSPLIKRCPIDQTQQTQKPISEQKNKESE